MKWHQRTICGFDLETTGTDPDVDHIVQIGFDVSIGSRLPGGSQFPINAMSYEHLVDPGVPIENSDVHGITDEIVAGLQQDEGAAITELVWYLRAMAAAQIPVVAYNAAFDLTFARAVALRHNVPWDLDDLIIMDPMVLDKKIDKWRKGSRKQDATAAFYGIGVDAERLHSARYDAGIGVQILRAMGAKYSKIDWTTPSFMESTRGWAIDQQMSLAAYFRKSGKTNDDGSEIVVKIGWPYFGQKGSE